MPDEKSNEDGHEERLLTKTTKVTSCPICSSPMDYTVFVYEDGEEEGVICPDACEQCERRYPSSLIKATGDNFEYACKLTSGEIIYFGLCSIDGDYVTLLDIVPPSEVISRFISDFGQPTIVHVMPHNFPRGLDVRVDQIVWCADAPDGS